MQAGDPLLSCQYIQGALQRLQLHVEWHLRATIEAEFTHKCSSPDEGEEDLRIEAAVTARKARMAAYTPDNQITPELERDTRLSEGAGGRKDHGVQITEIVGRNPDVHMCMQIERR